MNPKESAQGYSKKSERNSRPIHSNVLYGKVPPQAVEIEKALLGAMLLEKDKIEEVLEIITSPDCFYVEAHQRIFSTISRMPGKGVAVDLLTITEELRKSDELELVGGAYFLMTLTMNVVTSAHALAHARIIMEKYMQRELIRICGETIANAYEDNTDVFDLLEVTEKEIYELSFKNTDSEPVRIGEDIMEVIDDISNKRNNKIEFTGIPTGFKHLDILTGGWQRTDLIILAARPSVGKTAFAINLAMNASTLLDGLNKTTPTVLFSLEMGRSQITRRALSLSTGTKLEGIRNPTRLSESEVKGLYELKGGLNSAPIYVDDTPAITVASLKGKCRRLKKKYGIGLVIIDYLQLMKGSTFYKGNREQEISSLSRDLKEMGKELNVAVIALSQLSRKVEDRADKKPQLSDLRESGAIEQDADIVMFLYRPSKEDIGEMPELEFANYLDIAKHRNGDLDEMPLYKDLSIQKFADEPLINRHQDTPIVPFGNTINKPNTNWPQTNMNASFEPQDPEDAPY